MVRPVRAVIPMLCPNCGTKDSVIPITQVVDIVVELQWFCRVCRYEWTATRQDETPRLVS